MIGQTTESDMTIKRTRKYDEGNSSLAFLLPQGNHGVMFVARRIRSRVPWLMLAPAIFIFGNFSYAAPSFAPAVTNGVVNIPDLIEVSGVAASRNNPGVLWTHNDAGNAAVVYALDAQGRALGTYTLPGNTDNEDIAIGPGPVTNVSYLYVADIGDNNSDRSNIAIYQIPEPAVYFWQTNSPVSGRALKGRH